MRTTLQVKILNQSLTPDLFCVVTGYDTSQANKLMLLSQDGRTPYYPPAPPPGQTNQPIPQDCSIPLAPPGQSTTLTLPYIGGCRLWFSASAKLIFGLSAGPNNTAQLVEPSCTNLADPNTDIDWSFCELTFNAQQVFANISCVDFVSRLPVGLTLDTNHGTTDHVSGMSLNGFEHVVQDLRAQAALDKQPWDRLVINGSDGRALRVLSPNCGVQMHPGDWFEGYFEAYVDSVYAALSGADAVVSCDTQRPDFGAGGIVTGRVVGGQLAFDDGGVRFAKPKTRDVLSCCTGPFADGSPEQLCITPRLAAALNRGTLPGNGAGDGGGASAGQTNTIPAPEGPKGFYEYEICNHYARIVHRHLLDGRGYAFPYDDVCQTGGPDQCGAVYDSDPKLLTIHVGGNGAFVAVPQR